MSDHEEDASIGQPDWGKCLWDRFKDICDHTHKGLEFCETYVKFSKERSAIEAEYASKLGKLCTKYKPKRKDEEDTFTITQAFYALIDELQGIAYQHDTISTRITDDLVKPLDTFVHNTKLDRKRLLHRANEMQSQLKSSLHQLDKSKEDYQKSFMSMEKAYEAHTKAEANEKLSIHEQKKVKNVYTEKTMACEKCKQGYAKQREDTNLFQQQHYNENIPMVFREIQRTDERRVAKLREMFIILAEIERDVVPIITNCINGMVRSANGINEKTDSQTVVDKFFTGIQPPGDFPFDELISAASSTANGLSRRHTVTKQPVSTAVGTLSRSAGGGTTRGLKGLFSNQKPEEIREDFGHLAPAQQIKKLNKKIDEIKQQLTKAESEKQALIKLYDVYSRDASMGDPNSLDERKNEVDEKISGLNAEMNKFQKYLSEAHSRLKSLNQPGDSASDKASSTLSRTSSERSNNSHQQIEHSPYAELPDSALSPSVPDSSSTPSVHVDSFNSSFTDADDSNPYETEGQSVIGTATALYAFDPSTLNEPYDHAISMQQGEELYLVTRDMNGWSQVRQKDFNEGFVPTAYLTDITFFSQEDLYESPDKLAAVKDSSTKAPLSGTSERYL